MPEPIPNSRFVRNTSEVVEPGPRPTAIETRELPNARRSFFRPSLPTGFADTELTNAWTSVDVIRDDLRRKVDAIWASEPSIPGVSLTPKQRHEMNRAEVARVVADELGARLKLVKPVVANATKELETRRAKLTSKGSVKLDGILAQKALMIASHFSTLPAETRSLRIIEAMNSASVPASRELLEAVAWCGENLDLVASETLSRIRGTLVATADPDEYSNLTQLDTAIRATSEGLDNLERWAASLPEEA
jgi:hypothetical protein